jgi:hypothetical protein
MFLDVVSAADRGLIAARDENEDFAGIAFGLWVDVFGCSLDLPRFSALFGPLSLPLSTAFVVFVLRSSVTLDAATSGRSSSDDFPPWVPGARLQEMLVLIEPDFPSSCVRRQHEIREPCSQ